MLLVANSISPVMINSLLLLFVGNAVIGIVEGAFVARRYRYRAAVTIAVLIVANYASMFAGTLLFGLGEAPSPLPEALFARPLHHPIALIAICVLVAFALSVLIEWPCLALAARWSPHSKANPLRATIAANLLSYAVLGTCLFPSSHNTIGDDVQVAAIGDVVPPSVSATVYFIDDDGALTSIRLDGSNRRRIRALEDVRRQSVLLWHVPEGADDDAVRLVREFNWGDDPPELLTPPQGRVDQFRRVPGPNDDPAALHDALPVINGWHLGWDGRADLRAPEEREWQGISEGNSGVRFERAGETIELTFDTPFVSWWGRSMTMLPGELAVFELGRQICVLNLESRRVAVLSRGQGPVVLWDGGR